MTEIVTDVIIILDESESMTSMGNEPVESVNSFIQKQKLCDNATLTLVKFNDKVSCLFNEVKLNEFGQFESKDYKPSGMTAMYDAIYITVNKKLQSNKPNDVILLIITDGYENSSQISTLNDVKSIINKVQNNYNWNIIFMGANIDSFEEGNKMNIDTTNCFNYEQTAPGNLTSLCRAASETVYLYRKLKSQGNETKFVLSISEPIKRKEIDVNSANNLLKRSKKLNINININKKYTYARNELQSPLPILSKISNN